MKKVVLGLVGVMVLFVAALLVAALMQPDTMHVERSRTIRADAETIKPELTDMKRWVEWSPWSDRDPNVKWTFSDPTGGEGAWYAWEGNEEVGRGRMELTEIEPDAVSYALTFLEPFPSTSRVTFRLGEEGEGTKVTWVMDSDNSFSTKVFIVFADLDAMIGADFEMGLERLAKRVEA